MDDSDTGPAGGTVLVTGAAGFVGARLVNRLRGEGHRVVGVDLRPDPGRGIVAGDVTDPDPWADQLEGVDTVVHTAAVVALDGDEERFWRTNVLGTRRVLGAAAAAGVRRVVHLSSVTVYGFDFPDGVDESHPVHPNGSPYVDTKVAGEQVALQAHAAGDLEVVVIRPGDVYGPRSGPWTIAPVEAIRAGRMWLPMGGRGLISPIFVDNLVDALTAAVTVPGAAGRVINVTDGVGVQARRFFGRYCDLLRAPPPRTAPAPLLRPATTLLGLVDRVRGEDTHFGPLTVDYLSRTGTYDISRARRVLDYEPRVDLDEGFARTGRWLLEEGLA